MTTNVPLRKPNRLRRQVTPPHGYPICAALEYRLMGKEWISRAGTGRTIYFSSRRVLIECDTTLPLDKRVELSIEWPVRLENNVCLNLHITGLTVSAVGAATEVETLSYEFRTRAAPSRRINQTRDALIAHWRQEHGNLSEQASALRLRQARSYIPSRRKGKREPQGEGAAMKPIIELGGVSLCRTVGSATEF